MGGCWLWAGPIKGDGYGRVYVSGKMKYPHRVMYETLHGPIPAGMQCDHLCKVRNCCNPEHIQIVTPKENVYRSDGVASRNAHKSECPTCGGTYKLNSQGRRICRACATRNDRELHRRKMATDAAYRIRFGAANRERVRRYKERLRAERRAGTP